MVGDHVSLPVNDDEISEQCRATSKAPESVNGIHLRAESKYRLYWQLCTATKEGDFDKFIKAPEISSDEKRFSLSGVIDIQGPSGNSLLHVAAGIENPNILQVIVRGIPDGHIGQLVAKANNRGDTALHVAARAGRIEAAKLLLHHCGSIVHIANDMGNTALHDAVKNSHREMTCFLLSQGSRATYPANKEGKCPLYLAVEAESELVNQAKKLEALKETKSFAILLLLMEAMDDIEVPWSRTQGMSPVHGAVMHQREDMLQEMSKKKEIFYLRDARGGTPLHLASYMNYVDGVKFLLQDFTSSAFEYDTEGYLPIHVACRMGCLETIKELLERCPHPEEMLTSEEGQNILHVAAKYGMATVVKHILEEKLINAKDKEGNPQIKHHEKLVNAKDKEGNTPLHVATLQWQPEIVFLLTRRSRADLKLVNNCNLTALDIVDEQLKEIDPPLRKSLTRTILESAKAPRSRDLAICRPNSLSLGRNLEPPQMDRLKDVANTRMVVATLVATVTFAAGFSVPGGYNESQPDAGIATLLNKPMYDFFVICNTVALFSSTIAVVILLWTQIQDSHAVHRALRNARLPLLIALGTMSMAFMAGVYVTISKLTWIAIFVLTIGITGLFVILILYVALLVRLRYNCRPLQLLADYIIMAAIWISRSRTGTRAIRPAGSNVPDDSAGSHGTISEICVMAAQPSPSLRSAAYENIDENR